MGITRRSFLKYCILSSATLGLGPMDLFQIKSALAKPNGPKVLWLQGSGCSGCSISFLNRIADTPPLTTAALLTDDIDLIYHPTLMGASGTEAVGLIQTAMAEGSYLLVVEGGVPTAFGGAPCWPWSVDGVEVTFRDAVTQAAAKASQIVCLGSCACYGGVSAAGENPSGVVSVASALGRATLNVPGCPPHPDWMVWTIAQVIAGNDVARDAHSRPTALFGTKVHDACPRNTEVNPQLKKANRNGVDNLCLQSLGCRGPSTCAPCPSMKWNNGVNWCVDANANCSGCTEPTFPGGNFHVTLF
ncbi:MAG TPA: hydrogenase small subunit [Polyangiaceae bacterium]